MKAKAKTTLDHLVPLAEKIADLDSGLKTVRQKSNIAVVANQTKALVLFGNLEKLKIRSRFFGEKERDVEGRTLTMSKPTDSQVLSTARVLVQRALKTNTTAPVKKTEQKTVAQKNTAKKGSE